MIVNRRFLLKGMAAGGIAGLGVGASFPALAHRVGGSNPSATVLTLVNDVTADSSFLHAAKQANRSGLQVQKISSELSFMLQLQRQLQTGQPLQIIGLLDDAAGTLVIDLARSAGAKVHWLGQHSAEAGVTQHRLLTANNTEHYTRQVGSQSTQWMGELGYHLASVSAQPNSMLPFTPTASTPVIGSFVSFLIEA